MKAIILSIMFAVTIFLGHNSLDCTPTGGSVVSTTVSDADRLNAFDEGTITAFENDVATIMNNPAKLTATTLVAEGTFQNVGEKTAVSYQTKLQTANPFTTAGALLTELEQINAAALDLRADDYYKKLVRRVASALAKLKGAPDIATPLGANIQFNKEMFGNLSQQASADSAKFGASKDQLATYQNGQSDFVFWKIDPDSKTFMDDLKKLTVAGTSQAELDNLHRAQNFMAAQWVYRYAQDMLKQIASFLQPAKTDDLFLSGQFYNLEVRLGNLLNS